MTQSVPLDDLLAHREWVRRLAHALVRDPAAADDLAQEAWIAALRSPPSDAGAVRGWFRRVVVRLAMNRHRGEVRRVAREQVAVAPGTALTPLAAVARIEEHRHVVDAVLTLPSPARETVVLRFFEDLTPQEIAERTGVPASTVRSRLQRALEVLRERLDDQHGGDGRKWRLALVPLLPPPREHARAATGSAAAALVAGALLMKWKTLAAAAAVLLSLGLVWRLTDTSATPAVAPPDTRTSGDASPAEDAQRERRRIEVSTVLDGAPAATDAQADTQPNDEADPAPEPVRYRLDVTVIGPDGQPAAGAAVAFWNQNDGITDVEEEVEEGGAKRAEPRRAPVRDSHPYSRLIADADGQVRVRHSARTARVWVELDGATGSSGTLILDEERTSETRVHLTAPYVARGRITDAEGRGLKALVRVDSDTPFGMQGLQGSWSTDDGRFEIDGLARALVSETVLIRVFEKNHVERTIEVRRADLGVRDIDASLVRGQAVRGRFVDERGVPIASVGVRSGLPFGNLLSEADGTFSRSDLPPEGTTLRVRHDNFGPIDLTVPAAKGDVTDLGDIVLRPGQSIHGVLLRSDGTPYAAGHVGAFGTGELDAPERSAPVAEDGTFVLTNVGAGPYRVVARVTERIDGAQTGRYIERAGVRPGDDVRLAATDSHSVRMALLDRTTGESVETLSCSVLIARAGAERAFSRQAFFTSPRDGLRITFPSAGRYVLTIAVAGYERVVESVEALADREIERRVELTPGD